MKGLDEVSAAGLQAGPLTVGSWASGPLAGYPWTRRHLFGPLVRVVLVFSLLCSPALGFGQAAERGQAVEYAREEGQFKLGLLEPLSMASGSEEERSDSAAAGEISAPAEAAAIAEFALQRIAEIQGIPYRFIDTTNQQVLNQYPLIVMAQAPSNAALDAAWREALYSYVEDGGVLFVPGNPGSELFPLLGLRSIDSHKLRTRLRFVEEYLPARTGTEAGTRAEAGAGATGEPAFAYIDHPREREISLGNGEKDVYRRVIWSHGAQSDGMAEVLARFDDGSAAMLRNYYGRGVVYYFGLSFAESVLLPQTGGDYEAQRSFVNTVEPSADVVMLLVKALYENTVPLAVYKSAIPQARPTALLLSHDVDAQTSFVDSLKYAALAEEFGARATFFINTKYYENWMDIAYYSLPANQRAIRELARRGHEIGSHTVAHAREFDEAPEGTPRVDFSSYTPQKQITVNGEVRVSKQLLDRDVPQQNTVSFRAGYLAFPPELISVLDATGYRYDSSFSANDVLTTFPYFALPQRQPGAEQSQIIEIPVTFDDAVGYLTTETEAPAVQQWKQVVQAHAKNETISVLLIHPSDSRRKTYKLDAQRELMEYAANLDAWMGSIGQFGDFWRSRHQLAITKVRQSSRGSRGPAVRLAIHLSQPMQALHPLTGLVVPGEYPPEAVLVLDSTGTEVPVKARSAGGKLYLQLR